MQRACPSALRWQVQDRGLTGLRRGMRFPGWALRYVARTPSACVGSLVLLVLVAGAIAAPVIAPYDPLAVDLGNRLAPPSWEHPLGTDHLGRDILSRLMFGARATLGASFAVVAIATAIGVTMGTMAGFLGGWVDELIMRIVDAILAFPGIILALVVVGLLGPGLRNLVLGISIMHWSGYARVTRGLVLSLRERDFVLAACCIGAGRMRIMFRHLLPNILGPVVVLVTVDFGNIILGISGLNFIGLGVQLPHPEWGAMLNYARPYLQTAPLLMVFPGIAIVLAALSANLLGDALRDLLDPRYRRFIS